MFADRYRVDIAFETYGQRDPRAVGEVAAQLVEMLPDDSETLRVEAPAASPDDLARIAATVTANGPAEALRTVAWTIEAIAAQQGRLEDLGPMRRTVVEYLGD